MEKSEAKNQWKFGEKSGKKSEEIEGKTKKHQSKKIAENSEKIEKSGENQDKISEKEIREKIGEKNPRKPAKKIPNIFVKIIFL